jgi:hypothetical protein
MVDHRPRSGAPDCAQHFLAQDAACSYRADDANRTPDTRIADTQLLVHDALKRACDRAVASMRARRRRTCLGGWN